MSIVNGLKRSPIFSSLSESDLGQVSSICRAKKYNKGETIFSQGDTAKGFFLISSGSVRIFQLSQGGKEHQLHIFNEGETFGEAAAFSVGIFPACSEAILNSELIFIPLKEFKELISKNPSISLKVIASLSSLLHSLVDKMESITLKDTTARLVDHILKLSKGSLKVELKGKKGDLALALGMKQETLSRSLQKLKSMGLISVSGKIISIKNLQSLQDIIDS